MNAVLNLGKYFLAIPMAIFGVFHLMGADAMAGMVPSYLPGGALWVYLSGVGLIGVAVSIFLGKYDKLATCLLAAMMLLFILMLHLPGAMAGGDGAQAATGGLLKDLAIAGAAMMYATNFARDNSIVG